MRGTPTPLLLALVLSLGGPVTVADAQSAPCLAEAWLRVGWYTSVQGGPPRRANALWSNADPVALFEAVGGHDSGSTTIGSRPTPVTRLDATGVPGGDEALPTIAGTDSALVVQFAQTSERFGDAGTGTIARLRAVPERCMSVSPRITHAGPFVSNTAPTP